MRPKSLERKMYMQLGAAFDHLRELACFSKTPDGSRTCYEPKATMLKDVSYPHVEQRSAESTHRPSAQP